MPARQLSHAELQTKARGIYHALSPFFYRHKPKRVWTTNARGRKVRIARTNSTERSIAAERLARTTFFEGNAKENPGSNRYTAIRIGPVTGKRLTEALSHEGIHALRNLERFDPLAELPAAVRKSAILNFLLQVGFESHVQRGRIKRNFLDRVIPNAVEDYLQHKRFIDADTDLGINEKHFGGAFNEYSRKKQGRKTKESDLIGRSKRIDGYAFGSILGMKAAKLEKQLEKKHAGLVFLSFLNSGSTFEEAETKTRRWARMQKAKKNKAGK